MSEASPILDEARENLQRSYDKQKVITALLQLSLEDIPLDELLQRTLDLLNTIDWIALESRGSIFLVEDQPEVLVMKVQKGMASPILEACRRTPIGRCLCGLAASTRKIQFADGLDERHVIHYEGITPHGHYCLPILFGDRVLGVINLYVKAGHRHSPQEAEFLAAIANTLAGIIVRREAEAALKRSVEKLKKTVQATVMALTSALEMRDPYTVGHQKRVTDLACAIAKEIGFSDEKIEGMRIIGLLHDIGKIAVPAEILAKPGKIGEHEFNIIKTHAEAGYNILKEIDFPCDVAKVVVQHHERLNGSGYPKGLSGSEIVIEARILAVADVVEAMSSHRPYRPGLGTEAALREITEKKGILYDPGVMDICVKLFTEEGFAFA